MEKQNTYLTFWQKVAYGSGDFGSQLLLHAPNVLCHALPWQLRGAGCGIVGTLMAVSKLLDGITDVFFWTPHR